MNYIVFDLEWNQCPNGKEFENSRLPFEIIEIGAIKLNKDLEIIDKFHIIVKPVVYNELHYYTKNVIQSEMIDFRDGEVFHKAVHLFIDWCGIDYMFCTWGNLDLIELQRNMKYYYMLDYLEGPIKFYDLQKLFSMQYEDGMSRRALKYAVEQLNIPITREFHRALDDAYYTAKVMQQMDLNFVQLHYSVDTYQNPKTKKDELYLVFPESSKYISREFDTKEEAMVDKRILSTKCFICRKNLKKKVKWFAVNGKKYYSIAYCPKHGYLKGTIRMKKTEDGKYYVIKTMRMIDEEEALQVKKRQDELRIKRQMKRNDKSHSFY